METIKLKFKNTTPGASARAEKLIIKFDDTQPETVLQNRITKIGKWSFLTSKASNPYLQFIFTPSADTDDFNQLVEGRDEQYKQLLVQAYDMSDYVQTLI